MGTRNRRTRNDDPRSIDRRSFLKLGTVGAAFPLAASGGQSGGSHAASSPAGAAQGDVLPAIPIPADLSSDRLVHHFRDLFNPPAAQNEWGYLQATKTVSGITAISFPPFICCGVASIPFSPGDLQTCELYLNGQILASYPPPAGEVAFTWYPHRIVRETVAEGIRITTQTFLPSGQRACAEEIVVRNESRNRRRITLGFDLRAGITVKREKPFYADYTAELDNQLTPSPSHGCVIFQARHSPAVSVQGIAPHPARIEQERMLVAELSLDPGQSQVFHYLNVIGEDPATALDAYDRLQAGFDHLLRENEERFTAVLQAAFTPGNAEFSGHLPNSKPAAGSFGSSTTWGLRACSSPAGFRPRR